MSFLFGLSTDKSIDFCLNYALKIKQNEVKTTTYIDYKNRINQFKKFLTTQKLLHKPIQNINKQVVSKYLRQFKPKNRNNIKIVLSTIFSVLSDENIIDLNDNDKRNYFTRRFARFRKKFNIDKKFKLYSFRHT